MENQGTPFTVGQDIAVKQFITIERAVWQEFGLHAYVVYFNFVFSTGEVQQKVIDAHWQEHTARECARRWSNFYNCEVSPF